MTKPEKAKCACKICDELKRAEDEPGRWRQGRWIWLKCERRGLFSLVMFFAGIILISLLPLPFIFEGAPALTFLQGSIFIFICCLHFFWTPSYFRRLQEKSDVGCYDGATLDWNTIISCLEHQEYRHREHASKVYRTMSILLALATIGAWMFQVSVGNTDLDATAGVLLYPLVTYAVLVLLHNKYIKVLNQVYARVHSIAVQNHLLEEKRNQQPNEESSLTCQCTDHSIFPVFKKSCCDQARPSSNR